MAIRSRGNTLHVADLSASTGDFAIKYVRVILLSSTRAPTIVNHPPVMQFYCTVCKQREIITVCRNHCRAAVPAKILEQLYDLALGFRIHFACGLISEQNFGLG
jgi:hypothetical protein